MFGKCTKVVLGRRIYTWEDWTFSFIVALQCNYFKFIYRRLWLLITMILNKLYPYYVNEIFQILCFNFSEVENRGYLIYVWLLGIMVWDPKNTQHTWSLNLGVIIKLASNCLERNISYRAVKTAFFREREKKKIHLGWQWQGKVKQASSLTAAKNMELAGISWPQISRTELGSFSWGFSQWG